MTKDYTSDETTVVATYLNRNDADMAKSYLEDHGISSFVGADDVHTSLQFTEGVRLYVLSNEAQQAHDLLSQVDLLPHSPEHSAPLYEVESDEADVDAIPDSNVSWGFVVGAIILVIAIVAMVLVV